MEGPSRHAGIFVGNFDGQANQSPRGDALPQSARRQKCRTPLGRWDGRISAQSPSPRSCSRGTLSLRKLRVTRRSPSGYWKNPWIVSDSPQPACEVTVPGPIVTKIEVEPGEGIAAVAAIHLQDEHFRSLSDGHGPIATVIPAGPGFNLFLPSSLRPPRADGFQRFSPR
jgi:hypothetical protein